MTRTTGRHGTPIVAIVGWKNSGKTTLAVGLVAEFVRRGRRVATIKHAHHGFEIDHEETDSARHRRAGAGQVAIVSADRIAMIRELRGEPEPSLTEVAATLDPCDLIIVEGYKAAPVAKIEVRRFAASSRDPLAPGDDDVIAIAADHATDAHGRLVFALGDIDGLADLIERVVIGGRAGIVVAGDEG